MQFDEFEKEMIQVVKCHFEVIFCFLTNRKCDFFQVEKATIQVANGTYTIFCLLKSPKFDFGDFEKLMVQEVANHWELIFFPMTRKNATWVKSKKRCFKGSHVTLNSFSSFWPTQNTTWVRSINGCFKVSHGTLNLFWASGLAQNPIYMKSKKR